MPNPPPENEPRPVPPGTGTVSDPDAFGPDTPNVRDVDPKQGQAVPAPEASRPSPTSAPLDEADFAPDET